jgi:predicted S18 family serine protease
MSPKYTLDSKDFKSVGVTLLIVVGSAVVGQLLTIVPFVDFGKNSSLITVILIASLKTAQKYFDGIKPSVPTETVVTTTQ